ncbi:MAG: hypothetical protein OEZ13_10510 [Spirochaetia bacterium]|nr:hypothetical protein [Spirochaetia bacterium]
MRKNYSFFFALAISILSILYKCVPVKEKYIKEVDLNYSKAGFISEDIFQVICKKNKKVQEKLREEELRNLFKIECRKETALKLAAHKIKYDAYEKLFGSKKKKKQIEIELSQDNKNIDLLIDFYADLLPGYLVKEEETGDYLKGAYRIERENLIEIIQDRKLPVKVEIEY